MLILIFILGLAVGSFLNAAVYRISPARETSGGADSTSRSLWTGRSVCPKCRKQLVWWQLVPVVSFVILRGRCFNCQKPISFIYPLVELLTAISFIFFALNLGKDQGWVMILLGLLAITILIFIVFYDLKKFLILDLSVLLGILIALAISILAGTLSSNLISAILLSAFFGLIYLLSKGKWMGFGDVKLAVFLGLLNGPLVFLTLIVASWLGTLIGLYLILFKKGGLRTQLPFGTFLGLAAIAVFIWGDYLARLLDRLFI